MDIFDDNRKDPYHRADTLEELCALADSDFVDCAFVTLLGRQADPNGLQHYLRQVRRGVSKLSIIRALRRSSEGRRHDPGIAGLDRALRRHHRANLPVIGFLVRLFTGLEGNSAVERRIRAFENALQIERDRDTARFSLLHHYIVTADTKLEELRHLTRAALRAGEPAQQLAQAEDTGRDDWEKVLARALDG